MEHIRVPGTKVFAGGIPIILLLALTGGMDWGTSILVGVVLTVVSYVVGDRWILPATGNLIATLADVFLNTLLLWSARALGIAIPTGTILYILIAVLLVEGLFYHPFLHRVASLTSMGPHAGGDRK